MSFRVTIPGQPPSVNASYRIVRVRHRDGSSHQQLAKVRGLETYQVMVSSLVRSAKPETWAPPGQIRVKFWLRLQRDIDADNVLKALNDAIALGMGTTLKGKRIVAIYDDKRLLPCVVEKTTGHREPYVEVEISDASAEAVDIA